MNRSRQSPLASIPTLVLLSTMVTGCRCSSCEPSASQDVEPPVQAPAEAPVTNDASAQSQELRDELETYVDLHPIVRLPQGVEPVMLQIGLEVGILAPSGTKVRSASPGAVVEAGPIRERCGPGGSTVTTHQVTVLYGHRRHHYRRVGRVMVKKHDWLRAGDVIAITQPNQPCQPEDRQYIWFKMDEWLRDPIDPLGTTVTWTEGGPLVTEE